VNLSNTINHVKVYPNPFQDIVNIEFQKDEDLDPIFLKIIDNAGRIVFKQLLTENQNHVARLDLNHLKPGVYILQIEGSTLNYNTKIVK
jgi:hypothetical protein